VSLSVEDSGPGIQEENRERIFDPLFTTRPGGMGLGLAICFTVVANHGGKLRPVKSDADGSTFELALPVSLRP
jgi:signal transduction histidine kinase